MFSQKWDAFCMVEFNHFLLLFYVILFSFIDYQPNATHIQRHRGVLPQGALLFKGTFLSYLAMFTCNAALTFSSNSRHAWSKNKATRDETSDPKRALKFQLRLVSKQLLNMEELAGGFRLTCRLIACAACVSTCVMNILHPAAHKCVYK